jgi:hypothetical protein
VHHHQLTHQLGSDAHLPLLAGVGLEVVYGVYARLAALALLFALKLLPEPRGRVLS